MLISENIEVFRALADPTRLRIVMLLLHGELCVCDLTAVLDLPQSTVSRHMSRLRRSGLVSDRRSGKWVHYTLMDDTRLENLRSYLRDLSGSDVYRSDHQQLEKYLETKRC